MPTTIVHNSEDNAIRDRHFLQYQMYVPREDGTGYWENHIVYARSFECDKDDADMLTVVTATGDLMYANPVRNIRVTPCGYCPICQTGIPRGYEKCPSCGRP